MIYRISRAASIIVMLWSGCLYAQQGDYLITNHKPDINNIDNTNFQIIQDRQGLMYFANRAGILVYDGAEWDFYGTPGAALAMTFGPGGELFVGCLNDFGMIGYKDDAIKYISLSGSVGKSVGMIYQVLNYKRQGIFVGEKTLYVYDEINKTISEHKIDSNPGYYNVLFTIDTTLYANTSDGAIRRLDQELKADSVFYLPDSSSIAFIRQNRYSGMVIAGSYSSNVYRVDRRKIIRLKCSDYLHSNNIQLVDGYWYNDFKFIIGTLEKGCFILDITGEGNRMDTVDFDNGLPDNEVSALYVDNTKGIWVSHEFGLSRIAPELPIRSFTHFPGLEGNLFGLKSYEGILYVSTSVGVYYLNAIKNYKRTVYYIRKTSKQSSEGNRNKITDNSNQDSGLKQQPLKRGFLGLFRARKKQPAASEAAGKSPSLDSDKSRPGFFRRLFSGFSGETSKIRGLNHSGDYIRKIRTDLQSVDYAYKPVEGIKAKCRQIFIFNGKLLVATNSGIFDITDKQGTTIIDEPVRYLFPDTVNNQLIICGYDRSVKVYKPVGDLWIETHDVPFNEIITSAGMDLRHNLWLSSPSLLYKVELTDTSFTIDKSFHIRNQLIDNPVMSEIANKFYFIYTRGYFYFDGDTIREDENLKNIAGLPIRYIQSPDGLVWIFNGKTWSRIGSDGKLQSFEYLSLFPNMRFISYDSRSDSYRIVTADNKTYLYEHSLSNKIHPGSDLILRRITSANGLIAEHNKIILNWDNNTISFKFSEPDYLGLLKVEYQYKLLDHMKVWSEWSPVNSVNLNYLQPGKYSLKVRARDTFGRVKEADVIQFRVKPPYWKQPWFYVLELIFIIVLILLVKSLRKVNIRWPFIVDGLGILTLVIILALIQSTIQTYFNIKSTPGADFIVNVVVAIIAFPLEERLRKILI